MMQILDQQKEDQIPALFRLAFRPMFLFGGVFSCLALVVWGLVLAGHLSFTPYGGLTFWHSHEMLYGFVSAIIVGFLLTAVQNWTGIPSIRGKKLAVLTGFWLSARLLMCFPQAPAWLVIGVDMVFLPLAGYWLAKPIIAIGQMRNLFFAPILILLSAANLAMHLGLLLQTPVLYQHGFMSTIWLITVLMSVVGGRVIPFFTASGTQTPKATPLPWLEYATLGSTWVMFFLFVTGAVYYIPPTVLGLLLWCCAAFHAIRVIRWRFTITLKVPLLWSLHLAYWFIPIGIALMGASYLFGVVSVSTAFHALTVGAMGNMILSMMSRVSLGHTGRKLIVKHWIILAFAAVLIAALARVFGAIFLPQWTLQFIELSVVAWCVAYGLFSLVYFPVLTQPRADGRPG